MGHAREEREPGGGPVHDEQGDDQDSAEQHRAGAGEPGE